MTAENQPKKRKRVSMCVGCGSQIHDQYILRVAPDLEWHASCLKCADCNQYLDESCTCFVRDGKTYCKRDYVRLFGTKCSKCGCGFSKNDFVMQAKANLYHIDCFRCTACSRQLIPGDEFALRDDGLFCKADHDVLERSSVGILNDLDEGSVSNNNNNTNTPNNNSGTDSSNDAEVVTERKPSKREGIRSGGRGESVITKTGNRSSLHKSDHKTTRVRTVLNEKQLHTLRTCYGANPRPDALMKEQLVEMTALSPRVIRVWFQNKRCKDKKRSILINKMQSHQEKNGGRLHGTLQGVPMVATSPVRHDSHVQPSPVEVQSYHAPWKALSEFQLPGELEHPPFQQLINSFDHMEPSPDGRIHISHMDMIPHHYTYHTRDDIPPHPNSVESDYSGPQSELSSPISQ